MIPTPAVRAFARLELADALRSKWLFFTAALYVAVFGVFVALGLRESAVLGFTGISRVVINVANAVIVAFPLLVLAATCSVIVRARTSGLFEMFLAQPCRRTDWFAGVVSSRALVLLGPLVALFAAAALAAIAMPDEGAVAAITVRCLLVTTALIWSFLGLGLFLSSVARTAERAMVYALVAWVVTTALHDFVLIGVLLRTSLPPGLVFALAAVNPVEAARVGVLTSVDPELAVLGPVGFWLANHFGARLSFAVAVGWPLAVGSIALWAARRNLARADLVG